MGLFRTLFKISPAFLFTLTVLHLSGCSGPNNETASKAYVDQVVPVIFKDWDTNLILAQADPDLKNYAITNRDAFEKGIQSIREAVGSMKSCQGAKLLGKPTVGPDQSVEAAYSVDAVFEKGASQIKLTVSRHGGQWQMGLFNLDPQAELKRISQAPAHP